MKPSGAGPFPSVIIIHEWNGKTEEINLRCDLMVQAGYACLAPDLYDGECNASLDVPKNIILATSMDPELVLNMLNKAYA